MMKNLKQIEIPPVYNLQKVDLISILYRLLKELSNLDTEKDIYSIILAAAAEAVPSSDIGSILSIKGENMVYIASFGLDQHYLSQVKIKTKNTLLYHYTQTRMDRGIMIKDFLMESQDTSSNEYLALLDKAGAYPIRSSIAIPILSSGQPIGSIHLDSYKENAFTQEDVDVLEIFALELGSIMKLIENIKVKNHLLRYDEMTGILNRRFSTGMIKELIIQNTAFVLVSLDLNDLKVVNDSLGHEMGDKYIRYFVDTIKSQIPSEAIFARYGGDEFILVYPNGKGEDVRQQMQETAEKFTCEVRFGKISHVDLSFSYGIAEFPLEVKDYDSIMSLADQRMYEFKRNYKEKRTLKNSLSKDV